MARALLTLHVQQGVIENCGPRGLATVDCLERAATAARGARIPVLHVRMEFRPGLVDVAPSVRSSPFCAPFAVGSPAAQLHRNLTAHPDDIDVVSTRASAFKGSDLSSLLATLRIDELVLGGVGTSGVVLATALEGADLSFSITVLSDGVADPDLEVHQLLLDRVLPMRAQVNSTSSWIDAIGQAPR